MCLARNGDVPLEYLAVLEWGLGPMQRRGRVQVIRSRSAPEPDAVPTHKRHHSRLEEASYLSDSHAPGVGMASEGGRTGGAAGEVRVCLSRA